MDNFENIPQPNENQPGLDFVPMTGELNGEQVPHVTESFGEEADAMQQLQNCDSQQQSSQEEQDADQIPQPEPETDAERILQPEPETDAEQIPQPEQEQNAYQTPQRKPQQIPRQYTSFPEQVKSEPKQPRKKKKSRGIWKKLLASVLVLALVAGSCAVTAKIVSNNWQARATQMEMNFDIRMRQLQAQLDGVSKKADQQINLGTIPAGEQLTPAQVYALNVDAVVMVYSTVTYNNYGQQSTGTSTGSGFIISSDGYVLTNYHVIEGATAVSITTYDGKKFEAAIVGSDSANDIALLKVNGSGLPVAALGSSNALNVGDQVVAIGNPLGELTSTMTVGYVSGKERTVTTDGATIDMIQTDAAINSGNSGGPLFNMRGEVVGITTAKYSGQSSSGASIEGIGFAIPMDDVMEVVVDLMEYGYVRSGYMGVTVRDFDSSVASIYNLPAGVYVDGVEAGGPAAEAGIQPQDIIIGLGSTNITCYNDLARALRDYKAGDTTIVTVYRSGQKLELTITLADRPKEVAVPESGQPQGEMPSEGSYEDWYKYFEPFFGKGNSGG